jgi:Ca2+-dependent lipid-binding protein
MQQGTQQRDWLEVFVDSARGLPKTELIFKGDPYCILSLGGVSKRTTVKKRTHEPVWDENFSFDLPMDWRNQSLTVEVFDKDRITKDDFLGRTQISLGELEQELLRGSATVVRTLTHPKASGEIKLRFVLHSAGGFGEMGREGLGMNKNLPVEETMMPSQPLRTQ